MKDKDKKRISEIMECFDFSKVHRTMLALDWTWADAPGVPDEARIRQSARRVMNAALQR